MCRWVKKFVIHLIGDLRIPQEVYVTDIIRVQDVEANPSSRFFQHIAPCSEMIWWRVGEQEGSRSKGSCARHVWSWERVAVMRSSGVED